MTNSDLQNSEFVTSVLQTSTASLMSSVRSIDVIKSANQVEVLTVRTNSNGAPVGFSVTLKEALGAPLFRSAMVEIVPSTVSAGPLISVKESSPKPTSKDVDESEEEPSFLRKYWWVFVGALLLSSVLGPADGATQGASSAK